MLREKFAKTLFKEIRRRIQRSRETIEERRLRLDNCLKSKRDGLLHHPKSSYEFYIAVQDRPVEKIKQQFITVLNKIKQIGVENIHIYNLGLKSLVRPIKKQYQAHFLLVKLCSYPSIINLLRLKFLQEEGVLRILLLKDKESDKERRIYRDKHFYVRHPYLNTEFYQPFIHKLKESPYV